MIENTDHNPNHHHHVFLLPVFLLLDGQTNGPQPDPLGTRAVVLRSGVSRETVSRLLQAGDVSHVPCTVLRMVDAGDVKHPKPKTLLCVR